MFRLYSLFVVCCVLCVVLACCVLAVVIVCLWSCVVRCSLGVADLLWVFEVCFWFNAGFSLFVLCCCCFCCMVFVVGCSFFVAGCLLCVAC